MIRDLRPFFVFKNKNSKDYDILIEKYPNRVSPNVKSHEVYIEGRNGHLTVQDSYKGYEAYESYTMTFECAIRTTNYIDNISSWLKGSGDLILGNASNYKYIATISNKIDFVNVAIRWRRFLLQFTCQPFRYEVMDTPISSSRPFPLENKGNVYSEPIIDVYGNGNINLILNNKSLELINIEDHITLDSRTMNAYKNNNGILIDQNNKVNGYFHNLDVGLNNINWTGNITRVDIKANWRWI